MSLTDDQQWDLIQRLTAAEAANAKLTAELAEAREEIRQMVHEPWGGFGPWDKASEALALRIAEDATVVHGPHGQTARCVGDEAERAEKAHRTLCADSAPYLIRKAIPWMRSMARLLVLTEEDRDAEHTRAEKAEAALEAKSLIVRAMGWELHDIIAGVGLDDEAAEWNGMRGSISGPVLDAVQRADVAHVAAAKRALADMTAQRDARPDISRRDAAWVWKRLPPGARSMPESGALARACDALRKHAREEG